jgi:hypothetical protein
VADPRPAPTASPHAGHDAILVAALAADDLHDTARSDAEALVAACSACAALHADLRAIAAATKALPAPVRTRDYRLTAAQAERLRPSAMRRWLEAFASPRLAVTRPLAVAFTTLGIAGLLLTAIPAAGPVGLLSGAADRAAAQAPEAGEMGGPAASVAPEFVGTPPAAEPLPGEGSLGAGGAAAVPGSGDPTGNESEGVGDASASPTATRDLSLGRGSDPPWLAMLSTGLLAVGLALFALRFAARRGRVA